MGVTDAILRFLLAKPAVRALPACQGAMAGNEAGPKSAVRRGFASRHRLHGKLVSRGARPAQHRRSCTDFSGEQIARRQCGRTGA